MKNLKTYKHLFESITTDRIKIKNKIDKLFKKYGFDYMFLGWSSWRRDRDIIIDEVILRDKYFINGSENGIHFDENINEVSSTVIDELNKWYDDGLELTYLFEQFRFDVNSMMKILKVEKENVKEVKESVINEIFDDLIDNEYEKDLERKDFQDLLITDNFILPFFEKAYKYDLKNYLKDKYPEKWNIFMRKKHMHNFNI